MLQASRCLAVTICIPLMPVAFERGFEVASPTLRGAALTSPFEIRLGLRIGVGDPCCSLGRVVLAVGTYNQTRQKSGLRRGMRHCCGPQAECMRHVDFQDLAWHCFGSGSCSVGLSPGTSQMGSHSGLSLLNQDPAAGGTVRT